MKTRVLFFIALAAAAYAILNLIFIVTAGADDKVAFNLPDGGSLTTSNVLHLPESEMIGQFRPADNALDIGGPHARALWGRCWLTVDTKRGDVRIFGENKQPCIEALDRAVTLARNELRVNSQRKRPR
jgi:hypothetical protein